MSGYFNLGKLVGQKVIKEASKAIKSFKPGTKFKGQKTVNQAKMDASIARIKQGSFEFKEGVKKAVKKMKDIKSK